MVRHLLSSIKEAKVNIPRCSGGYVHSFCNVYLMSSANRSLAFMHHYRKSKASPRQDYDAAAAQGRKALEKRLRQQDSSEDGLVKKVLETGDTRRLQFAL